MIEHDFRGFVETLRSEGELLEVTERISPVYELAARVDAAEHGASKGLLFTNVDGYRMPVAAGLYGTTRRHLLGLGLHSMPEFAARLDHAMERPIPPEVVRTASPACQEVRFPESSGMEHLPIPTHFKGDAGPYITAGVVMLRDEHRRNAGIYRIQVHGSRVLTIMTNRFHDGHRILEAAAAAGRTVDVAISLGVDPAIFISAFWPVGPVLEELGVAGGLIGQPVLLAPAVTVDIEVPSHAEIVIEGRIRPGNTRFEGPFADITGQITSSGRQPVIEISAITTRLNPIYHTVLAFNSREHFRSRGSDFWNDYQGMGRVQVPGLAQELETKYSIFFPPAARNFHAVVALDKRNDEMPRRVIQAMFETYKYLKRVVVVDDDIDIKDPSQVEWAQATRVGRPEQVIIDRGFGSRIDSSRDPKDGQVLKMGIDATVPMSLRDEVLRPGLSESGLSNTCE